MHKSLRVRPAAVAQLVEKSKCGLKFKGSNPAADGTSRKLQKSLIVRPVAVAQLVEKSTGDPKFNGSKLAADGTSRK